MKISDYRAMSPNREDRHKPVCRVCGSTDEHSKTYNTPTMDCVNYLRDKVNKLEERIDDMHNDAAGEDL